MKLAERGLEKQTRQKAIERPAPRAQERSRDLQNRHGARRAETKGSYGAPPIANTPRVSARTTQRFPPRQRALLQYREDLEAILSQQNFQLLQAIPQQVSQMTTTAQDGFCASIGDETL
jgi:ribosomal protein S30